MIRLLTLILAFSLVSATASASCTSRLFSALSTATLDQSYPDLATGSLTYKNSVERTVLARSDVIFKKAGQLIQQARKNVFVQTWHFDISSDLAKNFTADLEKLARHRREIGAKSPIHIWLMANVYGFENATREQRKFEKFFAKYDLDSKYIQIHIGIFDSVLLGTNHAKTISVDDKVAVVTGANISAHVSGVNQYDLGFVVRGQIVSEINKDFIEIWQEYIESDLIPDLPRQQLTGTAAGNCLPIMFARNEANPNPSNRIGESSLNAALLNSVRMAKTSIDIMTPNLNVKVFRQAITKAVQDNVKVRIILSKGFLDILENMPTRGGENLMNATKLYRALGGFATRADMCKRLQIRWFSDDGSDAIKSFKRPNNHAKFMAVDGRITYFGSANMDNQSWVNSREIGLFVDNRTLAKSWTRQVFDPYFAKGTLVRECGGPLEPITVRALAR